MARLLLCGLYAERFFSGVSAPVYEFREVCAGDYVKVSGKFLLRADGRLFFLGEAPPHAASFLVNDIGLPFYAQPQEVLSPSDGAVWTATFAAEGDRLIAVDSFGRLWAMAESAFVINGGYSYSPTLVDDTKTWVDCDTAQFAFFGVTSSGELWSGGANTQGQCGRAWNSGAPAPWGQVPGGGWTGVKIGHSTTYATTSSGSLHACGANGVGQCGRVSTQDRFLSFGAVTGLPAGSSPTVVAGNPTCLVSKNGNLYTTGNSKYLRPPVATTYKFQPVTTAPFGGGLAAYSMLGMADPLANRVVVGASLFVVGWPPGAIIGLPADSPLNGQWYEHTFDDVVLSMEANYHETWLLVAGEGGPPPLPSGFWTSFNLTYEIP